LVKTASLASTEIFPFLHRIGEMKSKINTRENKFLAIGAFTFVICIWCVVVIVLCIATWPIEDVNIQKLAFAGETFGAVSALFTGLAFAAIILTLRLQRQDLKTQQDALNFQQKHLEKQSLQIEKQVFESTFFKMIEVQEKILSSTDLGGKVFFIQNADKNGKLNIPIPDASPGAKAFTKFYEVLIFKPTLFATREEAEHGYVQAWEYLSPYLQPYFSGLQCILALLDESSFSDSAIYHEVIKAMLTTGETIILKFHIKTGLASNELDRLIDKFSILKDVDLPEFA